MFSHFKPRLLSEFLHFAHFAHLERTKRLLQTYFSSLNKPFKFDVEDKRHGISFCFEDQFTFLNSTMKINILDIHLIPHSTLSIMFCRSFSSISIIH